MIRSRRWRAWAPGAGLVRRYRLCGLPEDTALASAILVHALVLGFLLVLGGAAFLLRRRAPEGARWSG